MKKIMIVLAMLASSLFMTAAPAQAVVCSSHTEIQNKYVDAFGGRTLLLKTELRYEQCNDGGFITWEPKWYAGSYDVVGGSNSCKPNPIGTTSADFYRFNFGDFGYWNPQAFEVNCHSDGYNRVVNYISVPFQVRFGTESPGGECWYVDVDEVVNNTFDNHWTMPQECISKF